MNKILNANRFANLTFDDFRKMAKNKGLSRHEKVGFPNEYREGKEKLIFKDFVNKLPNLKLRFQNVLEIGPGCSNLPLMLVDTCEKKDSNLLLVDSEEMLDHLPDHPRVTKYSGSFPSALKKDMITLRESVNGIIAYSVIQYVFANDNLWNFVDECLLLLAPGGQMLLGDIPNVTMRKRLFSSESGIRLHKEFSGQDKPPFVAFNKTEPQNIDDSVVLAIISRARAQGFDAWVVPQAKRLPMSNRREDILIFRP